MVVEINCRYVGEFVVGGEELMITVFIVDDHPFVREGLKAFLSTQTGICLAGEGGSGEESLLPIKNAQPDVVIVDLHLPGMGGAELTSKILACSPRSKIIILSSFSEEREIIDAVEAGALSYLMKDSSPAKLLEAIRAAFQGEPVLHPRIMKKLMGRIKEPTQTIDELTSKEKEVLVLLTQGYSNKEIAQKLFIAETTAKSHVSNILRKLEVNDRTQAVIKALKEDLLA